MSHSFVQINEGGGKKLGHNQRTIGTDDIHEQKVVVSEGFIPTYTVSVTTAVALSVANEHILQLYAGSTQSLVLRRLRITQVAVLTAAQVVVWQILRLTSAGTGGTAYTPRKVDAGNNNADGSAMTRPTAKGTESDILFTEASLLWSALPTNGLGAEVLDLDLRGSGEQQFRAGAGLGLALKNITAAAPATGTVHIWAEFVERDWI